MELDVVQADELVARLPNTVVQSILHELGKNNAWEKVANKLRDRGENIMSGKYKMNNSSPERELLTNLMNKYPLKVKTLQVILEQCQLYDALGKINTNDPAQILEPVEDTLYIVPLGGKLTLHVKVNGSPFPEMQWYFKGSPLVGQTYPVLVLENVSIRDIGEYTCKIKQGHKSELTSPKCVVTVKNTPPRISTEPSDVHIKANEDLMLSFEAVGYPEPKCFTWFKNGSHFQVTEFSQLRILAADVNNAGEYYCKATNQCGSCNTRTAVVKVQGTITMGPRELQIIEQPTANEVYYAEDWIYLTCKVRCSGDVKFVCFLNNKVLTGNENVLLTTLSSVNQHSCTLTYRLTEEQMEKENLKQLCFKFEIDGQVMSDDVRVEVKTRTIKKPLTARNKWALLIGNSHYEEMEGLPAASKDIHILKKNFKELGFRMFVFSDLKRSGIQNAVKKLASFIQEGDYVSFYYAGHGVHNNGKDYIIPVDARKQIVPRPQNVCLKEPEPYVRFDECISHVWIINILQKHKPALVFSIYDCCRSMKENYERYQSNSSEDSFQMAYKNSFTLFATSESYEAFEREEKDISVLVETLQNYMTHKIPVQNLSSKVLEKFDSLEETNGCQVPKVCGDLALSRSLADPSRPQGIDESEYGVLGKWEQFASGRGRRQHSFAVGDTEVEENIYWNIEPPKDGVTWIISNCLSLTINLSQTTTSKMQVKVKLQTGVKLLVASHVLNDSLPIQFSVHHLEELKDHMHLELNFNYEGQMYKQEMLLETPAISQQFYRGNQID